MTTMRELVAAAQEYDASNRPFGKDWRRVPDSQVARLLLGAKIHNEQRRVPRLMGD